MDITLVSAELDIDIRIRQSESSSPPLMKKSVVSAVMMKKIKLVTVDSIASSSLRKYSMVLS